MSLRPYRADDVNRLYEAVRESVAGLSQWLPWCHPGYSIGESRDWIASRADDWRAGIACDLCVEDVRDGSFLGGCGLSQFNESHRFANLGYWVRSGRIGRGVATAAALLGARFGFQELKLFRIEIVVRLDNRASLRVAEKTGAVREGILRDRLLAHGKSHDAVMFSLLPGELR